MVIAGPAASADVVGAASLVVVSSDSVAEVVVVSSVEVSEPQPESPIPSATAAMAMTPARMGMVMSSPDVCGPGGVERCVRRRPDRCAA